MSPRIGSLFSGYGGLEMGAQSVLGGEVAWHCEFDQAAVKVLAHHWPDVPNLGDITAVDWAQVEPVDVIVGGFPCQDISQAGLRVGIEGERSGLWSFYTDAIRVLRPRYVLIENVAALTVRGLDRVLADLAALRFDAEWATVRASDVHAAHKRARVFIAAANRDSVGQVRGGQHGDGGLDLRTAVAHADRELGQQRRPAVGGEAQGGWAFSVAGGRGASAADSGAAAAWPDDLQQYRAAIVRQERAFRRPVPSPREPGRNGERLSARFAEWLMGLPDGHVTGVPGISRNDQLKLLGNGVVPAQSAAAFAHLLSKLHPTSTEGAAA